MTLQFITLTENGWKKARIRFIKGQNPIKAIYAGFKRPSVYENINEINRRKEMAFGNKFGGGPRRSFGPREMHKAVCSDCGNECEVPFKPSEGKPVYCKECYQKHKKF